MPLAFVSFSRGREHTDRGSILECHVLPEATVAVLHPPGWAVARLGVFWQQQGRGLGGTSQKKGLEGGWGKVSRESAAWRGTWLGGRCVNFGTRQFWARILAPSLARWAVLVKTASALSFPVCKVVMRLI